MKMNMKRVSRLILLVAGSLLMLSACSGSKPGDLDTRLRAVLADVVKNNGPVRNCVLSVRSGDGSLSWSGAAGMAGSEALMVKDTPIYVASVTKLYTAVVIMRLSEKGALSLDDPMAKYLPGQLVQGIHVFQGRDYSNEVTIRQMLSHSSGIPDYYDAKGTDGKSLFDIFLENQDRKWTVEETIRRARDGMKPGFAPGKGTSYSDTNFQLLGKVIEAVTHKPLVKEYEEMIFLPLGLKHTFLVGYCENGQIAAPAEVFFKSTNITRMRSNGAYWAEGGIVSTADEMTTFLKALNEGRIVGRDTLGSMHDWRKWRFPLEYGLGTMLFSFPQPTRSLMRLPPLWGHSGSTGSFLYYCADADLYLAGTIDQADSQVKPFFLMYKVIKEVRRSR
jgi:D-alanyl-D-alanine carboxypeptidase